MTMPSPEEFFVAPASAVAEVAPETLIYSIAGTRRAAVLQGIEPGSDAYFAWSRRQMVACFALMFHLGVRHIIVPFLSEANLRERSAYRDRLVARATWGIAGPEAIADYCARGWQARLVGGGDLPGLAVAADELYRATPESTGRSIWFYHQPDTETTWQQLIQAIRHSHSQTREGLIEALYGAAIPPATLLISFGKPLLRFDLFPPLLIGELQCYWLQRPGFLTEKDLRAIFYDYGYTRRTWREDKTGRAEAALSYRSRWESAPILGLGTRLGPHWFPVLSPAEDADVQR